MEKIKGNKMLQYVNWRMRIQISETRTLLGTFMAYDKHMNLVLGDCEEYRKIRGKDKGDREEKRMLGLVLLRGENVISLSADTPPPPAPRAQLAAGAAPGAGKAAGRGMPVAPLSAAPKGLSGPVRGVGGPAASLMTPQASMSKAPVSYARGSQLPGGPPPPPAGGPPMGGMPFFPPPGAPPMMRPNMGRGGPM
jgi:small nuclear ribonucleoprotein B and B'